jgi:hypothetical protein
METIHNISKNGTLNYSISAKQIGLCLESLFAFIETTEQDFSLMLMNNDSSIFIYPTTVSESLEAIENTKDKLIFSAHSNPNLWIDKGLNVRLAFLFGDYKGYQYHCISPDKNKTIIIEKHIKTLLKLI